MLQRSRASHQGDASKQMPAHVCTSAGVDPKSIVCEFYRHGQCTKGFKCKFAHDLSVERKGAKIDLFTDQRDVTGEGEEGEEVRQQGASPPFGQ